MTVLIDIAFKENLAPIDLASLEVSYIKLFLIDITYRVKDYVTKTGVNIANASFPSGTHKFQFAIKDTVGHLTEKVLKITILDN